MPPLNNIFGVAIILASGFFGSKILKNVHFPAVTTYLIVGIIIGPHLLNLVPDKIIGTSDFISNFVLGVIAFSLGANFVIKELKAAGKSVFWISILEASGAWIIVTTIMIIYCSIRGFPKSF